MVSYHYSLKGRRLCRVTVLNGSNDRLKELSVTLLNRANSSTRSQKTPAVAWFGHLDFTREEPGTVQKGIELLDSFGENIAFIGYRKRLARLPSLVWVDDVLNSAPVISLAFHRNKNISQNVGRDERAFQRISRLAREFLPPATSLLAVKTMELALELIIIK